MRAPGLVADIGATYARFALAVPGAAPGSVAALACDDFPGLVEAVAAGRERVADRWWPRAAVIALAGPVTDDRLRLTNRPSWTCSAAALRAALDLERLVVVNDLTALALALPALGAADWTALGGPDAGAADAPRLALAVGTGFGGAALVPCRRDWIPVAGEPGHAGLAATDARQRALIARLAERGRRATPDVLISGPGLRRIYQTLAQLDGVPPEALDPERIGARAAAGTCPLCAEAVALFAKWLGAFAGDLALVVGARGGVYIGGGVVAKLGEAFSAPLFRRAFEEKGRLAGFLAAIPTRLIATPHAALIGAARAFDRNDAGFVVEAG